MVAIESTIQVASIGIPDTLFLMLLALVVFGPRRLPEIGRQIGKLMYEFRKVSNDFKFQMEEELRASEEAERQRKLEASLPPPAPAPASDPAPESTQVTLDVPPHPVALPEPAADEPAAELTGPALTEAALTGAALPEAAAADETAVAALPGEVRGEPRRFPPARPHIQPPSTGEPVAAARPFRERTAEAETVTESGSEPTHHADRPVVVADEGRVGTEVQPGVEAETERQTHHA
jgi:sec-independent protein translocase protein TatB